MRPTRLRPRHPLFFVIGMATAACSGEIATDAAGSANDGSDAHETSVDASGDAAKETGRHDATSESADAFGGADSTDGSADGGSETIPDGGASDSPSDVGVDAPLDALTMDGDLADTANDAIAQAADSGSDAVIDGPNDANDAAE